MPTGPGLDLGGLPGVALAGALVLCRVGAVVMVMPGLGEAEPPLMVRAGLALGLTLLVAPSVTRPDLEGAPPIEIVRFIVIEVTTGLFIGWLARLVAMALPIAGQLISVLTGLTSVIQPDPELGAQSSALARLSSLAAPVLLLVSGLYALPLEALSASYRLVPLGSGLPAGDTAQAVVAATGEAFAIGFRLAAPFLLIGTVWQVALGALARFLPSMQAGSALLPGQVLGGLVLLAVLSRSILDVWLDSARTGFASILGLMGG